MNRDDWLAAILIIAIITIGIMTGLYLAGFWDPNGINTILPFIQNKPVALTSKSYVGITNIQSV